MTKAIQLSDIMAPLPWTPGETCYLCRRPRPKDRGPDPCLGKLPGRRECVLWAWVTVGYVTFENGKSGPDPCLGKLPGVVNACCGHGLQWGYVTFENGKTLVFDVRQAF